MGHPLVFYSNEGPRQGDPLSPYLFSIAMEYFSILLELEHILGNLLPIHRTEPIINHLLYDDDILIMYKAIVDNAHSIKKAIPLLDLNSGLSMNEQKSILFFSKGTKNKDLIASIINVKLGTLPIIYLGIPLSHNKLKCRGFGPLINKINKKFNHWSSRHPNISGRIELVKVVIYPILKILVAILSLPCFHYKQSEFFML